MVLGIDEAPHAAALRMQFLGREGVWVAVGILHFYTTFLAFTTLHCIALPELLVLSPIFLPPIFLESLPHCPRLSSNVLLSVDEINVSLLHCENIVRVVHGDVRIYSFHCATASASPSAARSIVASLCSLDVLDKDATFLFSSQFRRVHRVSRVVEVPSFHATSDFAAHAASLRHWRPFQRSPVTLHILKIIAVDSGILAGNIFLDL
ncbi:hypothetical protein K438DRAFT_1970843 [Mycena galopus ATCC 62051]|nr:hypothetical protein K438DRAFT_1970843 [Mycena galopus ATCC 62051]